MALLTYGGVLLSPLTADINCCCGPDDTECPPCCGNIVGGALIDGAIRFLAGGGGVLDVEVTITTESGTRRVCQNESITISIEILTEGVSVRPSISWDTLWLYVSHTPSGVAADGFLYEPAFVDWGTGTQTSYSVELKLNPCTHALMPGLGGLQVSVSSAGAGTADIDIGFAMCPGSLECCYIEPECLPCCFTLDGGVYHQESDSWWFYVESTDWWMLVAVSLPESSKKRVCIDEGIEVAIILGTRTKDIYDTTTFDILVEIDGWAYIGAAPNPDVEPPLGGFGNLAWDDSTSKTFNFDLGYTCELGATTGPGTIRILATPTPGGETMEITLGFDECFTPETCNCCCRHCCIDCHFPVADKECEIAGATGLTETEVGGATQIIDFLTEVTSAPPAFCGATEADYEVNQTGLSLHNYVCEFRCQGDPRELCARSICSFAVPLLDSCDGSEGFFANVSYQGGGVWNVSVGGVGYTFWVSGRTSYSGDCNGATASGTFVFNGFTYVWTTSFTVIRDGADDAANCN